MFLTTWTGFKTLTRKCWYFDPKKVVHRCCYIRARDQCQLDGTKRLKTRDRWKDTSVIVLYNGFQFFFFLLTDNNVIRVVSSSNPQAGPYRYEDVKFLRGLSVVVYTLPVSQTRNAGFFTILTRFRLDTHAPSLLLFMIFFFPNRRHTQHCTYSDIHYEVYVNRNEIEQRFVI